MTFTTDTFFVSHPDPMWVYDLETLRFLAVNNAAIAKYGYTRAEFLAMTIADIRPPEDREALAANVKAVIDGPGGSGVWRHCLRSGAVIYVDINGHTIDHNGRRAKLISARDVSRLVIADQITHEALAREKAARQSSDTLVRQFQKMFDNIPGMFVVFSPETFDVVAVSDAYLSAVKIKRHALVGRYLFDVLPPQPGDATHANLRASFDRVLATGTPDLLELQTFMLPGDAARLWAVSSTPVTGPDERLLHLILRMQDVTDAIASSAVPAEPRSVTELHTAKLDIVAHTHDLKTDNIRLAELAIRLRTTQRLLATGTWDYVTGLDRLEWSDNVYAMYGTSPGDFGHRFEDYLALVHPDDRAATRANFDAFIASEQVCFSFEHQALLPDGRIVHVHGVVEKTGPADAPVLRGVVQNVTEAVESARALAHAKRMLEIAGTSAKFGAWRYQVHADVLEWSTQTARIHDEPDGFSPKPEDALTYFAPEYQTVLLALLQSCLDDGVPFGETLQIVTAKGRRLWVRVTGEVERDESGAVIALQGSFQDISELETVRKRAEESEGLLEIAGRAVRLGGWRVSLVDNSVSWTDGVAAIHELPPGTRPSFDGGIDYFAPEEQQHARRVFEACANEGIPFNNVRKMITAKGNHIKVRSIGEPVYDAAGKIIAVQGAMQDISELSAAQQIADDLTRRLADTLENIGDAFFTLDREWRFSYLNNRAGCLLERSTDALLGRNIFEEFPQAVGTEFEVQYLRAVEMGETRRFEQFFPPLDRWFRVSAHPTPEGLAVYFLDISQERQRDQQLRLLDAAVAHINDIVVITEAGPTENSKIVYVNEAFVRLTGFTKQEAIGQTPRLIQGPKTQRAELDRIRAAVNARLPVRAELINYTKSGTEYWLEIDVVPISDDGADVTHFVAIQRDITHRRRAEEALRISETRFRFIARATGNAVWEWDIASGRLWWSEGMAMFGHPPHAEGTLIEVWNENVHPEDMQRVDAALRQLLSGIKDDVHERYRFCRADGTWANVENHAFLVRDDEGRAVQILGSMTDISERLEMEERLRQSQKLEAVGQLTGGVAHDFNNLLTVIMGNNELLQDHLEAGHPLRKYADMSAIAADRAAELTNRLLAFSRKQALQPQVTDINAVVSGIEGMMRRTLGEAIAIDIALTGDLWKTAVDLSQLEAALLNLAINARDAMPDGGTLTIETANTTLYDADMCDEDDPLPGHYIVTTVSDTGHGIPKDVLDRVFEPFFTTKAVGEGTGLGLSMVYGFVKQTGGLIRVQSQVNEGTSIKLYFPRFHGEHAPLPAPSHDSTIVRGQETILVVEDDTLIAQQLTAQLWDLGYKVLNAAAGEAALSILRTRADIDLLFTDIILPGGLDGRQVAATARSIRPALKVLYTSGYSDTATAHKAGADFAGELLRKPYRRSDLASKIRKVLDA